MDIHLDPFVLAAEDTDIINTAQRVHLAPEVLYEAVIDLSSQGLLTARCVNMAAFILLEELGLPNYFFQNIGVESLKHLLGSIANSITIEDGEVRLYGRVAHVDFGLNQASNFQRLRIATRETRDDMEKLLEDLISGHRREYYYSPKNKYYTYIVRPETVQDFSGEDFSGSRFLFSLAGDYTATPKSTRKRYEAFLDVCQTAVIPLIEVFNLPETGETRLMFNSDFACPQLPALRKLMNDHGFELIRAYWEPYRTQSTVPSSICSLYVQGELPRRKETALRADLGAFLCLGVNGMEKLYITGKLTFQEMLFASNAVGFTHLFIFKERDNATDREIIEGLATMDQKDVFASRLQSYNKSTYGSDLILKMAKSHPDLIKFLYNLFEHRFNPALKTRLNPNALVEKYQEFKKLISTRFMDSSLGYDIFNFMFKMVDCTLKTNFYKQEKRSFSFRFDNRILDPIVFSQFVYGIFYVNGHYACGTHLRAGDIARGGLRLIRVSASNHAIELDNAVLLNYALGPKTQRLKHKDICESGSKGVVVPHSLYADYSEDAISDYTEGIMDLVLGDPSIIDYFGEPEMIFFDPDEGTAPFMDAVSFRARDRGYKHWRTITTGKSFGIPHGTYGMLDNNDLFGLFNRSNNGVELQINEKSVITTQDMDEIYDAIGGRIETSGMTTTGIMSSFRALIHHSGHREEDLNLMMTGGPDGDLGANVIQCYKGNICLIVDGGSILFDPDGLDKRELIKIAFMRHTSPRANSLAYPVEKLSAQGFRVPVSAKNITLPDGTFVEEGTLFHRTFLYDPANRKRISQAKVRAFIPCGGFKDTIHHGNVKLFVSMFKDLEFIVEGANVFFDNAARRYIAAQTAIRQIKDSTANKGGVFSSSIAEVLTAFLLGDDYEKKLLNDTTTRWALIRDIMLLVDEYAIEETVMLIRLHEADRSIPLFVLSEQTSEQIFAFQATLYSRISELTSNHSLVWGVLEHYIPGILIKRLGKKKILDILNSGELKPYRDAILTKKMASLAFYKYGIQWEAFLADIDYRFEAALASAVD
ncbi:GdhA2 [Desulforapulum autotrophicum HRM2]|uniref:GdhA2 n=1 Tax=Desulforapulum autotrophicum (strain ATCC 43914 / DSM 3382 / VKM B-1955 / HRM2) TaxID=177437 RepID=C0QGJ6_DESAH|nr:NAD-glutamate dehydrogenase domain-containing protein [Desulforapulum autotrophicum]ACN13471.1 GdhA2 [Desulforapulum autotrophicum HRM2]